jgi:hypothetical protein
MRGIRAIDALKRRKVGREGAAQQECARLYSVQVDLRTRTARRGALGDSLVEIV